MSEKFASRSGAILMALVVSGLLFGCNLAPPPVESRDTTPPKKVPIKKVATIKTPTGWPKEIPLYPKAELESVAPAGAGYRLVLTTQDTAAQIFNWYYDELEARQWDMAGPTLDVAQNIAVISGNLGDKVLFLEARSSESKEGITTLALTANLPQPVE